jgi:hypothetical protein
MSETLALKCPSCGSLLQMQDFDVANGVVKCSYCRALMPLPSRGPDVPVSVPKAPVEMPKRITVQNTMDGIEIQRRWFTPTVFFLIFFCIFWDGFLVFWYSIASQRGSPVIMSIFPLVHVAAGVFITYLTFATMVNTTRIAVGRGLIKVRHGPLPWWGQLTMPVDDFKQFYCKEKLHHNKNGSHYTYEVWAALKSGDSKKILSSLNEREQAIFIEQEIERALNLKDHHVSGETLRY